MTWIVMPGHTNALGTVFGGQVMAWIDVCAAVAAQRFARRSVVTASMDHLIFRAPIHQGDITVLQATVNWAGRSSMEVGVRVECEVPTTGERRHTSTAYLTFVALNNDQVPCALPELDLVSDAEKRRFQDAKERREHRLDLRNRDRQRQTKEATR
jgi:acyl-CoA hydrolase